MLRESIIETRKKLGLTQAQLAERTGIAQNRISEFESGKCEMKSGNLDKIIEVLKLKFINDSPIMSDKGTEAEGLKDAQFLLSKKVAAVLLEKGYTIENVNQVSKEDMIRLTGNQEILLFQVVDASAYNRLVDSKVVNENNTYNYFLTLVKFQMAVLK